MSNPFSATGTFSANPSVNAEHNLVTPYTEEYNLAIEHQFAGGRSTSASDMWANTTSSRTTPAAPATTAPNINLADPPIVGSTVAEHQSCISRLPPFRETVDPIFHSTMNSLQLGVHKQYTRRLRFRRRVPMDARSRNGKS